MKVFNRLLLNPLFRVGLLLSVALILPLTGTADLYSTVLVVAAVSSTGVPLFAGIEDLDDMFITTMEEMDKEIQDELSISHPIWEMLQRRNLIEYRDSIGTHVPVKLRTKRNPTVKWMTAYDDADSTPSEVLDEAKFAYGHLTGRQLYNREELVKNSGPEQLIDMVESK